MVSWFLLFEGIFSKLFFYDSSKVNISLSSERIVLDVSWWVKKIRLGGLNSTRKLGAAVDEGSISINSRLDVGAFMRNKTAAVTRTLLIG